MKKLFNRKKDKGSSLVRDLGNIDQNKSQAPGVPGSITFIG